VDGRDKPGHDEERAKHDRNGALPSLASCRASVIPSCPRSSRASTIFGCTSIEGVDGRDKPGHDKERAKHDRNGALPSLASCRASVIPSCPRSSPASTIFGCASIEGVDGRDKPGHDGGEG
jgi:hypothetical protein